MVQTSTQNKSDSPLTPDENELAALAQMTGYKPDVSREVKAAQLAAGSIPNESLLDEDDFTEDEDGYTKTPLWSNPIAKGLFVAFIMALIFGSIGVFLLSVNNRSSQDTTASKTPTATDATPPPDNQEAEIGRLKTTAALGSQQQLLEQNSRINGARILPQPPQVKAQATPTAVVRPATIPYSAAPRSYSQPVRPATPLPMQRSYSAPSASYSTPSARAAAASVPAVDPQQAWLMAQAVGSYGQTSSPEPVESQPQSEAASSVALPISGDQSRYGADAAALLSGVPSRIVAIAPGATAQAELMTPIIWAQDLSAEEQPQKFNIQLTEPLLALDGTVALPKGTRLVASVGSVSESGLLSLSIVNAIIPTEGGQKVIAVPPGAVEVSSDGGKPLIAQNHRSGSGALLGHDIAAGLLGALSGVGALLNRPSNQSTTTTPFLSSTSVSNSDTNILGGILEGGFGAVQDSISERQQSQVQSILSRPQLWYVKAGKSVQVFVNSQFEAQF